jgi:GxxExxY protein
VRLSVGLIVDDQVIVEIKSVEKLAPIHTAQMITYLKLTRRPVGLLLNFNVSAMKYGVRRIDNKGLMRNNDPES